MPRQRQIKLSSGEIRTHAEGHSDVPERHMQLRKALPNHPPVSFSDSFSASDWVFPSIRNALDFYTWRGIVLSAGLVQKYLGAFVDVSSGDPASVIAQVGMGFSQGVPFRQISSQMDKYLVDSVSQGKGFLQFFLVRRRFIWCWKMPLELGLFLLLKVLSVHLIPRF